MPILFLLVAMSAAPHWTKSEEEEEAPAWDSAEYPHHHFVDYIESTCNRPYLFIANIFLYFRAKSSDVFTYVRTESVAETEGGKEVKVHQVKRWKVTKRNWKTNYEKLWICSCDTKSILKTPAEESLLYSSLLVKKNIVHLIHFAR